MSEIIEYDNIALIDLERGTNGTTPSLHGIDSVVRLISTSTSNLIYNFLDQAIDTIGIIGITGMPPNTIILNDASTFPTNGDILIDGEIITYTGKTANYLENVVRGVNGTTPASHSYGANVYIIDTGLTIQGTINLISSSASIMEFLSGHNDFPKQGTIQINSEIIKYYDMVLYNITRGVATTPISDHINGLSCYNFTNLIDNTLLSYTINSITLEISISNYGNFTPNGTILIGKELITYSSGIGIINVVRGIVGTIPSIHNIPVNIYSIPLLDSSYSTLSYNMQSEDTGIPILNNTSYNVEGMVLIDSEIIAYYNKKTIDNIIRGSNGSTPASHLLGRNVYNLTGVNTISSLSYDFPTYGLASEEDALPVTDISQFSNNGKIQVQTLVSGEIVKEVINYTNKGKSLVCSERGSYGSTIVGHQLIFPAGKFGVIYRITDLLSVSLKNTIEPSDESVVADGSIVSYPSTGIIRVGRELMEYSNKNYGMGVETRGYRESTITTHTGGIYVYDLPIVAQFTINPLLVAGRKITSTDLAVPVQSSLSAYPSSGYIVLGHEVINYTNKNQTLVTDSNTRGFYDSIIQSHLSGATVNSVTTIGTRNVIDSEIQTDFIPLTASHTFPSSGDLQVDSEIIGYTSTNNTIVSTSRGSFNTIPTIHSTGSTVRNIIIQGNTFATESIAAGQTSYIPVNNTSIFSESGGYALLHAPDQSKSEIIQYAIKGSTISGVTRGVDQSIGIAHAANSDFTLIENSITGIQLINDIDNSQTLIGLEIYDMMGVTLLPTSGILALNDEILEYNALDMSLINANRAQNGTSAGTYNDQQLINKIRDYNEAIPLHSSSITDITINYPFEIEYLIRGTNNTVATSHSINDNIILLSDSHIDISNVNYIIGDLNETDNFILLNSLEGLSELVEGSKITIDNEIMLCGNIITSINVIQIIERGADGTVPAYHYNRSLVVQLNNSILFRLSSTINNNNTSLTFRDDSSNFGSMLFTGTVSSYLTVANTFDIDFAFETGDFTIEWWQYQTDNVLYPRIFSIGTVASNNVKIAFSLQPTNDGIYLSINNVEHNFGALPLDIKNNWVHFAIVRVSGAIKIYKNGTQFGSTWNDAYSASYITVSTTPFRIGNESVITDYNAYGGYLTNFHWVKGTALYLTNFTPSISVITAVANTKMLLLATTATTVSTDSSLVPKTITNTSVTWSSNSFISIVGNNLQLSLPPIGTIIIGSEIIKYKTKYQQVGDFTSTQSVYENYTLDSMIRGTNSTSAATHTTTTNIVISLTRNTTTLTTKTLNGEITNTATTITLNNVTSMATSGYILIDNEVIKYTGLSSPDLTGCIRGYGYTTKNYHVTSSVVYIIDEPYQFFTSSIPTSIQTYVGAWTGNMPLNVLGNTGTFLIDSEIIQYYSTTGSFTSKLMDCERDSGEITYRYPPANIGSTSYDGASGTVTLSGLPYGNGLYTIFADSAASGYGGGNSLNCYNVSTTLSTTISNGSSTSDIVVGSTDGFPIINGKILIENEIISYTSKTSNSFVGITRGVNGTIGAAHSSGVTIYLYEPSEWRTNSNIFNATTGVCIAGQTVIIEGISYYGPIYSLKLPTTINPSYLYLNENTLGKSNQIVLGGTIENVASGDLVTYNNWELLYTGGTNVGENYIQLNTTKGYKTFICMILSIVPNGSITYGSLKQFALFSRYPENYGIPISTYQELQAINTSVTTLAGIYTLINDITIPDGTLWTEIGNSTTPFTGTFNGNNKTINGLSSFSSGGDNKGLFGYNTGTIKNVIVNVTITITLVAQNVGGLVGYNEGTITNCSTSGYIYITNTGFYIGGLCGNNYSSGVINYSNSSCFINNNLSITSYCGGFVGLNIGIISDCYATGNIIGTTTLGGFVGRTTTGCNINKCYSTGNVTSEGGTCGGFIGYYSTSNLTLIQNSYSSGNVTVILNESEGPGIGGFAGAMITSLISTTTSQLNNCYSIGLISISGIFPYSSGGFIGVFRSLAEGADLNNFITNSFWNSTTAGVGVGIGNVTVSGLYSKTTTEMKTVSTFITVNWHLVSSTWILTNNSYPSLLNNYIKHSKYSPAFCLNSNKNVSLVKNQLSRNITASDTTIGIVDSTLFGSSGYLLVDTELIRYSSKTNNILSGLIRGLSVTNASVHSSGYPIYYLADVPKLCYLDNTTYDTQSISFDVGPSNGINITSGLISILNTTQEFVKVDSIIGYNKNTHNADSQFLIGSEIMSSTKTIKTTPNILENRIKSVSTAIFGTTNCFMLMDPNGIFMYISDQNANNLIKIRLSDMTTVSIISNADFSGTGYSVRSGIIDSAGLYGYFGTASTFLGVSKIVKVNLSTMTSITSLLLLLSLKSAVIDFNNQYGYFGSSGSPVYKVNLSDMTYTSTTAPTNCNDFISASIDPYGTYIYFGTNTVPAYIVKYTISSDSMTSLIAGDGNNYIASSVIDKDNIYGYFTTSTIPSRIIKLNLATFTISSILEMDNNNTYSYNQISFGVIDKYSKYAYFGTDLTIGTIIKLNLSTFTVDETIQATSQSIRYGVIDINSQYLYINYNNVINKYNLDYTPSSSLDTLSNFYHLAGHSLDNTSDLIKLLNSYSIGGTGLFLCGVVTNDGLYGYFATNAATSIVYKINLKTMATITSFTSPGNKFISAAITSNNSIIYFGTDGVDPAKIMIFVTSTNTFSPSPLTIHNTFFAVQTIVVANDGNVIYSLSKYATPLYFIEINPAGVIVTFALLDYSSGFGTGGATVRHSSINLTNTEIYFTFTFDDPKTYIVKFTKGNFLITDVLTLTISSYFATAGILNYNDSTLYFGSSGGEKIYKVPTSVIVGYTSYTPTILTLGTGNASASIAVAIIEKFGKYAYFVSNTTLNTKIYQVDLTTFTQTAELSLGANKLIYTAKMDIYENIAYFPSSTGTQLFYKIGVNYENNLDFIYDKDSSIAISSITYNGTTLGASTITPTSSNDIIQFNQAGGFVALLLYSNTTRDVSKPTNMVLVKYQSISSNVLQNVTVVSSPTSSTLLTFTKMVYIRASDNMVDPFASGLLSIGQNQISVSNDLIPISGTLINGSQDTIIKGNNVNVLHNYIQPTITNTNVYRHLRDTTSNNYSSSSTIIRVTSTSQDYLRGSLNNSSGTIPITNGYIYGYSGYLLIDSEIISYNNGYGLNFTRGAYNTTPTYHYNTSSSYYCYELGASTTLRSSIDSTIQNIPLTSITGLTLGNKYLITSASGLVNPEVLSGGSLNNTIDSITRNIYSTGDNSYTDTGSNIQVYSLQSITSPSTLRTAMTNSSKYVSLVGSGSSYPSEFNNMNYILIDQELMPITSRYSFDGIASDRNKYFTESARIGYKSTASAVTVNGYSTLRQFVTNQQLFFPLTNASSYPSSGRVIIDGEWIEYNSKNSFDFAIGDRGKYTTTPADYSANADIPLLLINTPVAHSIIEHPMTNTTKVISIGNVNTNYSDNGIVLIGSEMIKINSKETFDIIIRNRYLTETVSSTNINFDIINTSVVTGSPENTIRDPCLIGIDSSCIQFDFADDGIYGVTGVGLLDGEFFTWESKNSLDGLTRGVDGTSAVYHHINTGINIVAEIGSFPLDIDGNIIVYSATIQADKVLLSDETSGIKILDSQDITTFPPSGTIVIGSEKILYQSNKSLASITRNTNGTTTSSYLTNTNIYLIDTTVNTSITYTTLASSIVSASDQIILTSIIGFGSTGTIIINSEIINYTGILGNTLTGCTRGRYLTTSVSHLSGTTIYLVPLQNVVRTTIIQDMNVDDLIVGITNTTGYPTQGTVLIGSEIITYQSKNALSKITHGHDSTIARGYIDGTSLEFTNILLSDEESTVLIDTSSGDVVVDLPSAVDIKGRIYTIKKISSANNVLIQPYDTQLIDLQLSLSISQNLAFVAIQSDGVNWKLILNSQYDSLGSATQAQSNAITAANLYTDNAIASLAFGITSTDFIVEGSSNLYFKDSRVVTAVQNNVTTDDIDEGLANLYFNNERAVLAMTGLYDPIGSAATAQTNAISIAGTNAVNTIVAGAPSTMNTLNKIATALNNDSSFYDTIITLLAEKLNITTAFSLLPPVGTIVSYGGSSAPSKWLFCQGQVISRTTYSALFTAIGTTYGIGDGSTTFNLPDCRGRTLIAPDASASRVTANNTLGAVAGSQEIPAHHHLLFTNESPDYAIDAVGPDEYAAVGNITPLFLSDYVIRKTNNSTFLPTLGKSSTTGTGTNNLPPYLVVNYIIFANV
jgi:microcystin-dependent protein